MRKTAVLRLFLPFPFAFIGVVLAFFAWYIVGEAGLLWDCGISMGAHCMLVGSILGSLFGCALAFPRGSASTGRRILSFILALVAVILVPHAFYPLIETIPRHYDDNRTAMSVLSLLVIPALSFFGFFIPVLLYALKYGWTRLGKM